MDDNDPCNWWTDWPLLCSNHPVDVLAAEVRRIAARDGCTVDEDSIAAARAYCDELVSMPDKL